MHNFIIDFRKTCNVVNGNAIDREFEAEIFNDECRRFLAVHPDLQIEEGGVHSGELEVNQDEKFNLSRGGRPTRNETLYVSEAQRWRDMHRDNIAHRQLVRPQSNWYRLHNRVRSNDYLDYL